mmetsp:Transcript_119612/g.334992  ORF Transcript_119612/g.334992 Transcript_119612/m.334992 type:complete len:289 (-) Transcript_119612:333-1199(-)
MAFAQTIIYVDVDGVLNVSIHEPGMSPLLLDEGNCDFASGVEDLGALGQQRESVERLVSVMRHSVGTEAYRDLACASDRHCVDTLVARLAEIIRGAGPQRLVVLASAWRLPKYAMLVKELEANISKQLGERFSFDARTPLADDKTAAQRLRCIGEHLRSTACGPGRVGALKVVVVDDFGATPLDGWMCQGSRMSSVADVEAYLRDCVRLYAPRLDVRAKMVHCYAEWATPSGLRVQIGAGLTREAVRETSAFLASMAPTPVTGRAPTCRACSNDVADVRTGERVALIL